MHYLRKVEAFAVDPTESHVYATTIGGQLICLDADDLRVVSEVHAHAGQVPSVTVHPSLPLLATLAVDYTISIWDRSNPAALKKMQTIPLRAIKLDGYEYATSFPLSCPIAFHPRSQKLLTHNASGALCEIAFDGSTWSPLWAVGLFNDDPNTAYDIDYVRYLIDGEQVFASTFGGHLAVLDPKTSMKPLLTWRYGRRTIHCAEHWKGTEYLLASDTRRVIRFDVSGKKEPLVGPGMFRDHVEQIALNKSSGRVFATSFDRTILEIDPETCTSKGVAADLPFKLRWIHSFEKDPDSLLVQCRNGGVYKTNLGGKKTFVFKDTPNALWTAVHTAPNELTLAGEGPDMLRIVTTGVDPTTQESTFSSTWTRIEATRGSYAKRMVVHEPTSAIVQGRSDGEILLIADGKARRLVKLGSPVRDLTTNEDNLYLVTEDGCAYRLSIEDGSVKARYQTVEEPLWSLAYNAERNILAVCEREGKLHLLDGTSLECKFSVDDTWAPKRMKWRDADRLVVGRGDELYQLDVRLGTMSCVVPHLGNTIEDFDWDKEGRYVAVCNYVRSIHLFEADTWNALGAIDFDLDTPKGVVWLDRDRVPGAHPYELVAFGRSGVVRHYRVHDDCLHHLGTVNRELSEPIHDDAGVLVRAPKTARQPFRGSRLAGSGSCAVSARWASTGG